MLSNLEAAVLALVERVLALSIQDAELRNELRQVATAFLDSTDERVDEAAGRQASATTLASVAEQVQATIQTLEAAISSELPEEAAAASPMPELTLGRSVATEPARPVYPLPRVAAVDFATIEARCRLKAEGARWAATRRRLIAEGANFSVAIDPKDRDIIARAKELPNCYLWMCHPSGPSPSNLALYEEVAGCFEAMAEAVTLVRQIQDEVELDQAQFEGALDLLAEAQSALRVAIGAIDGPVDTDQTEIFRWLKATATETQIFIHRFMRLDDPADPKRWPALFGRIESVEAVVQEARRRRGQRKKLLGKVRHKTTLILNDPAGAADEWKLLIGTVCELLSGGLPPSNRELRELLIPVIEFLPEQDGAPPEFESVLREIDRYMATCPPPETTAVVRSTPEVVEVANRLQGRSLVLIGGDKRPGAYQALKEAFGLRELIWIETRSHESIAGFEPYVARSDVAAVLLAIRWSSHSYGEVRSFCEVHNKPLVRLPGGYNPNQVAAQIMNQCSEKLRA
jgi:hypothetical protein